MHCINVCIKDNHEITPTYDGILILKPYVSNCTIVILRLLTPMYGIKYPTNN